MSGKGQYTYFWEYPQSRGFQAHLNSGDVGGIDYLTPIGTLAHTPISGKAIERPPDQYGGLYTDVGTYQANGQIWNGVRFVHLDPKGFVQGRVRQVKAFDLINYTGDTGRGGAHLHFEWWVDGQRVDPQPYINNLLMAEYRITIENRKSGKPYELAIPMVTDNEDRAYRFAHLYQSELVREGNNVRIKEDNKTVYLEPAEARYKITVESSSKVDGEYVIHHEFQRTDKEDALEEAENLFSTLSDGFKVRVKEDNKTIKQYY